VLFTLFREQSSLKAPDIISNLSVAIVRKHVSRFNITRSNVWDGAVRGFNRVSYSEFSDRFVKFSDDAGTLEEGLDTGGPRRELLTLLMSSLWNRPIFDGPPNSRYLVYNSVGMYLINIEEKHSILEECVRWYVIDRNHSVIKRFKDGLATLQFLTALEQHPSVLSPFLCHTEKKLTATDLENLFKAELSPVGSNQRQKESRTLSFWSDYLLDCEEHQTEVPLENVLMFATGLTSLPPAGVAPQPWIVFLDNSLFPTANTCTNTLKLPILETYSLFQTQMDFGIQNSPGFGCI
ncbi:G2/M phase-specific E3 ubiquitin-protein ligase-like, partial [Sinocyclocheilus grahami]|uniref:G2/M phase-specific E3 ubiquitin-protein ligase-like n=1 Tax=Sinocyclocheilus grahami TaxID=75366 RepID=UPI0007AC99C9